TARLYCAEAWPSRAACSISAPVSSAHSSSMSQGSASNSAAWAAKGRVRASSRAGSRGRDMVTSLAGRVPVSLEKRPQADKRSRRASLRWRTNSVAAGHRARRIADPAAPGRRVETRQRVAGQADREQVVAGSDARAAVGDRLGLRIQQRCETGAQRLRRKEATVRPEVAGEGHAACAGDVSGDRVDRLLFTTEARLGA